MEKCKICKKESEVLEKHHIIPKSRGGKDTKDNLISICVECHEKAHDVSFRGEKGLISEGASYRKQKELLARNWLEIHDNEQKLVNKLDELYNKNEKKWNLIMTLIENNYITAGHLKDWVLNHKMKLKCSFTL